MIFSTGMITSKQVNLSKIVRQVPAKLFSKNYGNNYLIISIKKIDGLYRFAIENFNR